MSNLYTIENMENDVVYAGIEYRRQQFYEKGSDLYVPLSKNYTGKDEQIIYLKRNANFKTSFRRNGRVHQDLIMAGDLCVNNIAPGAKHKMIGPSIQGDRILVLIKYQLFQIERPNTRKEKTRQKITTLGNNRDYNLIEIFPQENLIVWNPGYKKEFISFDQIISSK